VREATRGHDVAHDVAAPDDAASLGDPGSAHDPAIEGFYDALLDDDAEALYERAPCGYLSTTPDGTIVKVNQTFLTWTGHSRDDLVGRRTFSQLLTAGGRIYHETHYAPMLRMQDRVREIALEIVCADGRRLPALVNSVLERDESGQPRVVRTAVFDASERRSYERELLRAKKQAEESEARATLLARTLQQTLIPPAPPVIAGLDIAAAYRPAGHGDEIGGDFYDIFELAEDDWVVAVGDVCGKGVTAAVVTAVARHTIRAAAVRHPDVSHVLDTLNEVLLRDGSERFCTAVLVRLRKGQDGWSAAVTSAGHPLPLLSVAGARAEPVGGAGSLLGVLEHPRFRVDQVALRSGDRLVLYTDGVTEARRDIEFYGDERLLDAIDAAATHAAAEPTTERILGSVVDFQRGMPRDDIVVVVVRVP
jgi:sigma-B regulation protein RsbU (phosphoserine phosphatase)